jgi:anti-sigma factor RsiW
MNVTRDVIADLLPAYLAGEASADTRALVDEYLRGDAELAARVRAGALEPALPAPDVAPGLEARALGRTRRRLGVQRWLFGLAWFFTAVSLSTEVTTGGGPVRVRLLIFSHPALFAVPLLLAVACWASYFALRRRAAVPG